jgi:hypoxanthine phosphoribosyltransferase
MPTVRAHTALKPSPVSKIGAKRYPKEGGLRQIVTRDELREQVVAHGRWFNHLWRGQPLTFVPILHGGMYFYVDLTKEFDDECSQAITRAVVGQASGHALESGSVTVHGDWISPEHIEGRIVLVIDDVFDTGRTAETVIRLLEPMRPADIKLCCLLWKERERRTTLRPDYRLFDIENVWVVGYGLDGDGGRYRHLRYIAELSGAL